MDGTIKIKQVSEHIFQITDDTRQYYTGTERYLTTEQTVFMLNSRKDVEVTLLSGSTIK